MTKKNLMKTTMVLAFMLSSAIAVATTGENQEGSERSKLLQCTGVTNACVTRQANNQCLDAQGNVILDEHGKPKVFSN